MWTRRRERGITGRGMLTKRNPPQVCHFILYLQCRYIIYDQLINWLCLGAHPMAIGNQGWVGLYDDTLHLNDTLHAGCAPPVTPWEIGKVAKSWNDAGWNNCPIICNHIFFHIFIAIRIVKQMARTKVIIKSTSRGQLNCMWCSTISDVISGPSSGVICVWQINSCFFINKSYSHTCEWCISVPFCNWRRKYGRFYPTVELAPSFVCSSYFSCPGSSISIA